MRRVSTRQSGPRPHPLPEPRRRAREDRLRPAQRLHQHSLRRVSFADRRRVERRRARRPAARAEAARRESSVRPPQVRDARRRRHRAVSAGRRRRGRAGGVRPLPLGRRAVGDGGQLRHHARHAGDQHRRRPLRAESGAPPVERAAARRCAAHAERRADVARGHRGARRLGLRLSRSSTRWPRSSSSASSAMRASQSRATRPESCRMRS